jgi:putative membrane protein
MIRALIFAPLLFLLVLFALSNPQSVHLGLWPTDFGVDLPLSIALLLAAAFAFFLGAALLWLSVVGARLRARRAEHAVKLLEAQVASLQSRLAEAQVLPPSHANAATALTHSA